MKKIITLFALFFTVNFAYAFTFDVGGYATGPDTITVGSRFDINWGFTIRQDNYGETYPAMTVEMKLYLSKDNIYDASDVYLSSDNTQITPKTGTVGETTYDISMPSSDIPSGICYLLFSYDPDDKIKDSKQSENIRAVKIVLVAQGPDLEVSQSKITSFIDPNPLNKLIVNTEYLNSGNAVISLAKYKIELANTLDALAAPAYSFEKQIANITTSPRIKSIIDTIDIKGHGININDFYIKTTLISAAVTEKFTNNNSITSHILETDIEKMDINYDYVFMKSKEITLTSCNSLIFDDGGEKGNYSPSINSLVKIYPATPGTPVQLVLDKSFSFYNSDELEIYGDATATKSIQSFDNWSTNKTYTFTSTSSDGSMAIKFSTNSSNETSGFKILQTCKSPEIHKVTKAVCTNPFVYNGFSFTRNTDTILTYKQDSIVYLSVTIGKASPVNDIYINGDYSIMFKNVRYFASKNITEKFTNKSGCDSTVIYHLNITKACLARTRNVDTSACNSVTIAGTKFSAAAKKTVTYADVNGCDSTVVYNITIKKSPVVNLGKDLTLAFGSDTVIGITPVANTNYKWNTGETSASITVAESKKYSLTATNGCGSANDDIVITILNQGGMPILSNISSTEDQISIYPTISSSYIKVHCPGYTFSVINSNTQTIHTSTGNEGEYVINVAGWAQGVYHLYFYSQDHQPVVKSIIVQ